jgi:hypothetical protein
MQQSVFDICGKKKRSRKTKKGMFFGSYGTLNNVRDDEWGMNGILLYSSVVVHF